MNEGPAAAVDPMTARPRRPSVAAALLALAVTSSAAAGPLPTGPRGPAQAAAEAAPRRDDPLDRAARHDGVAHPGLAARVEVLEGRARLFAPDRIEALFEHLPPLLVEGPVHLDVRAAARVRVTWPGQASVLVHGPAALEWRPAAVASPAGEGEGLRTFTSQALRLDVLDLGTIDLEARRGAIELALPGAWRTRVERAALQLSSTASGAVELWHHAGLGLRLEWLGDKSETRPPVDMPAGSRVHLDRPKPPPRAALLEERREPWPAGAEEWPWRMTSDTPEAAAARMAAPRRTERLEGWRDTEGSRVTHVEAIDDQGRVRLVPLAGAPEARPTSGASEPRRRTSTPEATAAQVPVTTPTVAVEVVPGARRRPRAAPAKDRLLGVEPTWVEEGQSTDPAGAAAEPGPSAAETPPTAASGEARPQGEPVRDEQPLDGPPRVESSVPPSAPPTPPPGLDEPTEIGSASGASPEPPPGVAPGVALGNDGAPTPADESAAAGAPRHDPTLWRGLQGVELEGVGAVHVERARGVEVRALPNGRVRVLVDSSLRRPIWCFVGDQDYHLAPGATMVFERDGTERLRIGQVVDTRAVGAR